MCIYTYIQYITYMHIYNIYSHKSIVGIYIINSMIFYDFVKHPYSYGTGNLSKYLRLMKSWILDKNIQDSVY